MPRKLVRFAGCINNTCSNICLWNKIKPGNLLLDFLRYWIWHEVNIFSFWIIRHAKNILAAGYDNYRDVTKNLRWNSVCRKCSLDAPHEGTSRYSRRFCGFGERSRCKRRERTFTNFRTPFRARFCTFTTRYINPRHDWTNNTEYPSLVKNCPNSLIL